MSHHPSPVTKEVITINEYVIIVDGTAYKKHDHEGKELEIIDSLTRVAFNQSIIIGDLIAQHEPQSQNVKLVLTTSFNNSTFIIMSLNLNANQFSLDALGLIDTDTNLPVAATFANNTFTSDNSAVFTTTQDAANPNQTKDVAVAPGVANLLATSDVTYTDSVTNQPVTKSLKVSVVMTVAAIVAGENVALVINQGTPQLQ